MAVTQTQSEGNLKALEPQYGIIEFTSTTATVELSTSLSEIHAATFVRVGDVSAAAGMLTIDETFTDGVHTVSSGAITVDRQLVDVAGTTLATESFLYILYGKS